MRNKIINNIKTFLNSIFAINIDKYIYLSIFILPFLIFGTQLSVGGDDTRLFYFYPSLWYENIAKDSWFNFSGVGAYNPQTFIWPFLFLLYIAEKLSIPFFLIQNILFSIVLITGHYFFKVFLLKLSNSKSNINASIVSLFYIFSPIIILSQYSKYLYGVWLIPWIPIYLTLLISYLKIPKTKYLLILAIVSIFFSHAIFSIPWLLGFLVPFYISLILIQVLTKISFISNLKRFLIFNTVLIFSQSFWMLPLLSTIFSSSGYVGNILTSEFSSTFYDIVLSTSKGNNILYPLLNLFHYQIQVDYNWQSMSIYKNFYGQIIYFNFIFPIILILPFFNFKRMNSKLVSFWIGFLVILFLFTVNIGFLKEVFVLLGSIPGFAMFRAFYDKFALGFVMMYGILLYLSLESINLSFSKNIVKTIQIFTLCVVILNAFPLLFGWQLNKLLWTTKNTSTSINTIPADYLSFMSTIKNIVPPTSNILSLPYGVASYTVISEQNDHAFVGTSPVRLFSGLNDFSGDLSFGPLSKYINRLIKDKDYSKLLNIFTIYNIKYIIFTKNISNDIKNSYLYNKNSIAAQDENMVNKLTSKLIISSKEDNYDLYEIKNSDKTEKITIAQPFKVSNSKNSLNDSIDLRYPLVSTYISGIENQKVGIFEEVSNVENATILFKDQELDISDNTDLIQNYKNIYRLKIIENNLIADEVFEYSLDGKKIKNDSQKLFSIEKDIYNYYLKVNDSYIPLSDIDSYEISIDDNISLYESDNDNILDSSESIFTDSFFGDCNQVSAGNFTNKQLLDSSIIKLSASNNHNACLRNTNTIDSILPYAIKFKYFSNTLNSFYFEQTSKSNPEDVKKENFKLNLSKDKFTYFSTVIKPSEYDDLSLYLYSGKVNDMAVTEYRDISLNKLKIVDVINLAPDAKTKIKLKTAKLKIQSDFNEQKLAPFSDWNKINCYKESNIDYTKFDLSSSVANLSAEDNQNACIYLDIPINHNNIYEINYDFIKSNSDNFNFYVDFDVEDVYSDKSKKFVDNKKYSLNKIINPPKFATKMSLYLYSGKNKNKNTSTEYSNLKLFKYSKSFYSNLLLSNKLDYQKPDISNIKKISNDRYDINISNISSDFSLNFADTYSDLWQLVDKNGNKVYSKHIVSNEVSNLWWFDYEKNCKINLICQLYDGKYSAHLSLIFDNKLVINSGIIVSATTVIMLSLICLRNFASKKLPLTTNPSSGSVRPGG